MSCTVPSIAQIVLCLKAPQVVKNTPNHTGLPLSKTKRLNAVCYFVKISAADYQNVNWLITYPNINCIQITQEIQGLLLVLSVE